MSVGFGVVGLGMGKARARLVKQTSGAELVAVCDINQERLQKVCDEFGCRGYHEYDEMLKDKNIDVVYIMTPSGTHLDFAKKAARRGKHIITTKPMEITVSRCEKFIELCEKNNVALVVDFELRYKRENQQLKAAIENGELGDILFAEARCKWYRTQEYYDKGGWRGTWKYDGGGSAANQGIHVIDQLVWMCGKVEVVSSIYGVYGHKIETEDCTVSIIKLKNGNPGCIVTTTNHHLGDEYGISLSCKNGSVSNFTGELKIKMGDGSQQLKTEVPELPGNAVEDMLGVLNDNKKPFVSGYEGMKSIELLEQIYKKGRKLYRAQQ